MIESAVAGPIKWGLSPVAGRHELLDSGDQFFDAGDSAPPDRPLLRNHPKPGLLLVEPGAVGGGVVHMAGATEPTRLWH